MGWTGGYVLLALLLAPYLRKFGKFTVPDFVGDRYESRVARVVAVLCAIFVSFTYVAGQMRGVGVVFSRFLEVDITLGVIIGMGIVFFYAVLGGMKGITYTQVAQYCVLIFAFTVPAVFISLMLTDNPIPQLGFVDSLGGSVGIGDRGGRGRGGARRPARQARRSERGARVRGLHRAARRDHRDERAQGVHRCLRDHARADGGHRGAAPRHHPLLHRAPRAGRADQRVLGAAVHRAALHRGARGGGVRADEPDRGDGRGRVLQRR
jgi:hypothetical protein